MSRRTLNADVTTQAIATRLSLHTSQARRSRRTDITTGTRRTRCIKSSPISRSESTFSRTFNFLLEIPRNCWKKKQQKTSPTFKHTCHYLNRSEYETYRCATIANASVNHSFTSCNTERRLPLLGRSRSWFGRYRSLLQIADRFATIWHVIFANFVGSFGCGNQHQLLDITLWNIIEKQFQ